jgi:hypothetical protein
MNNRVRVVDDENTIADPIAPRASAGVRASLISEIADILLTADTGLFDLSHGSLS